MIYGTERRRFELHPLRVSRVVLTGARSKQKAQFRALQDQLAELPARPEAAPPPLRSRQRQRRLTPAQVIELVAQYQAGVDMHALAEQWVVHRTTVAGHI